MSKLCKELIEKKIVSTKEYIETLPLENEIGTKKMRKKYHQEQVFLRNDFINKQIKVFTKYQEVLKEELNLRYQKLLPKKNNYQKDIDYNKEFLKFLVMNNKYSDIAEKLGFRKLLTNIDDSNIINLITLNNTLKLFIDKLALASINITEEDFAFSIFTQIYMNKFFKFQDNMDFTRLMKEVFDKIYWECPNFLTHLKCNMINILEKNSKELEKYYNKINNDFTVNLEIDGDVRDFYHLKVSNLQDKIATDSYNIVDAFLTDTKNINEYLPDSKERKDIFSGFLKVDFDTLDKEAKENFYQEILGLEKVLKELKNYYRYKNVIDDVIERYKKKDTYKGIYQGLLKDYKKKQASRLKAFNKYKRKTKDSIFNRNKEDKTNLLKIEMNKSIEELNDTYGKMMDAKFNETIYTKFDDGSPLSDVLELASSSYYYLKEKFTNNELKDVFKEIDSFQEFVYNPNNLFTKQLTILNDIPLEDFIYEKYHLLSIELTKEELEEANLDSLLKKIEYISFIYSIKESKIDIEKINTICKINDLKL